MSYWPIFVLIALLLALSAPATAAKENPGKRFLIALPLSFFGVILPLFVFLFSVFLLPEWKGGCRYGWIDGFYVGKLALTPLVLAATAALYALEILRVEQRTKKWIVTSFFFGAVVSSVCFVFGLFTVPDRGMQAWLIVPFYVACWYCVRATQLMRAADIKPLAYVIDFCASLPFWIGSAFWSWRTYLSLPDAAPDCFVVTAASRGHHSFVGPFVPVTRRGQMRWANRQLLVLWQFEVLWQTAAPNLHAGFRRVYNRLGPRVAERIRSPWLADAAYLALKPAEWIAALVLGATALKRFNLRTTTL